MIYKKLSAAEGKGNRESSYTVSEMYMVGAAMKENGVEIP